MLSTNNCNHYDIEKDVLDIILKLIFYTSGLKNALKFVFCVCVENLNVVNDKENK